MAMAGAEVLAEELSAAGRDLQTALRRYEQRLRPAVLRRQVAGRAMADWFVPATPLRLAIRDLITRLSTWPGVRLIVRRSLAVGGEL